MEKSPIEESTSLHNNKPWDQQSIFMQYVSKLSNFDLFSEVQTGPSRVFSNILLNSGHEEEAISNKKHFRQAKNDRTRKNQRYPPNLWRWDISNGRRI